MVQQHVDDTLETVGLPGGEEAAADRSSKGFIFFKVFNPPSNPLCQILLFIHVTDGDIETQGA